ncbi:MULTISPECIES: glycosyltransferase family 1 protein [unclassified Coleofasciculus]|uniref:glycosyltransferase family 1 protein n=1 Tax=unclassified Coleofasciculus TaxID=2692782 RepID=UPI001882141E|nr:MULTISPECIES: glycosyltransferase family 1 protein [unclassified Coleofasciculus]MBE9125471.1 glycosyltransferase family 1 protein [Coleofasciculus sp. LEGE 07081]MBE9147442.1 glycosyltransferase family 1 protein [Coleofasciculus sp. LEGE 07092]
MNIVQIVPRLPPYTDGVGDYSLRLAEQLLKAHGITTQFLAFQQGLKLDPMINGFPVIGLPAHNLDAFLSVFPKDVDAILVHYSNYPYLRGKLDAPFWLVDALRLVVRQQSLKLVVMFHELPRLKFKALNILNPIQSRVSCHLAKLATTVITDSAKFQAVLEQWVKHPVTCIPDFSTIGEPDRVPSLAERQRRLIIFGGSDRHRAYKNYLPELLYTCQVLGIEEICDIGKSLNLQDYDFQNIRLVEKGFQPNEAVRQLLLNSLAGFLDYSRFPGDLGKSSVFASFCAHGLIPLSSQYNPSEADGLEMKKHYLIPDKRLKEFNLSQLQTVADNANKWYNRHNLTENTKVFTSHLIG